jgi:hypothetical protein
MRVAGGDCDIVVDEGVCRFCSPLFEGEEEGAAPKSEPQVLRLRMEDDERSFGRDNLD